MNKLLESLQTKSKHTCCFHTFRGPLMMVVPDGHVVEKCCECDCMRTVHIEHREHGVRYGLRPAFDRHQERVNQQVEGHFRHWVAK